MSIGGRRIAEYAFYTVLGKLGPGKSGPWIIWILQIVFIEYKYIHIGESMSVGIGYILPTIEEYM